MKKKSSKAGSIILFPILLIVGIGLLWWNEGNYVKVASAIKEARSDYVEVKDAKYDSKNDKKVITTSGKLVVSSDVVDDVFKIKVNSALLNRKVEMYQWDENCDEDNHCTYDKKWSDSEINSSSFKSGHSNPSMKFESETYYSDNVEMGEFTLTKDNLSYLSANKEYKLEEEDASNNKMKIEDKYLYDGKGTLSKPEIGDTRISFSYLEASDVSALGVQSEKHITKFVGKSGKSVMYTMAGVHSGEEMFQKLVDNNKMMTWLFRLIGCVLLILAVASIFAPLRALTDRVPVLGGIVGGISGFFALLVGLALSIVVIAVAWVAYRPVASVIAILVAVAVVVLFIKTKKKKSTETPVTTQPVSE